MAYSSALLGSTLTSWAHFLQDPLEAISLVVLRPDPSGDITMGALLEVVNSVLRAFPGRDIEPGRIEHGLAVLVLVEPMGADGEIRASLFSDLGKADLANYAADFDFVQIFHIAIRLVISVPL